MKYFLKTDTMDFTDRGFPKKFPIIYRATQDELRALKELLVQANIRGFKTDIRAVYFDSMCDVKYNMSEIIDSLNAMEEVSENVYNAFENVPCWNPIEDAISMLSKYIDYTTAIANSDIIDEVNNIIEKYSNEVCQEREVKING